MKLKRGIALLLAAVFLFGTLAVPASAAAAQPEPAAQAQTVDAEENDIISVRIKASGELTCRRATAPPDASGTQRKAGVVLPMPSPVSWRPMPICMAFGRADALYCCSFTSRSSAISR